LLLCEALIFEPLDEYEGVEVLALSSPRRGGVEGSGGVLVREK
jgi:hypothetical protein